jgi:hypothetical protein
MLKTYTCAQPITAELYVLISRELLDLISMMDSSENLQCHCNEGQNHYNQ